MTARDLGCCALALIAAAYPCLRCGVPPVADVTRARILVVEDGHGTPRIGFLGDLQILKLARVARDSGFAMTGHAIGGSDLARGVLGMEWQAKRGHAVLHAGPSYFRAGKDQAELKLFGSDERGGVLIKSLPRGVATLQVNLPWEGSDVGVGIVCSVGGEENGLAGYRKKGCFVALSATAEGSGIRGLDPKRATRAVGSASNERVGMRVLRGDGGEAWSVPK